MATDVQEVTKEDIKVTVPSRYKVVLHNDNVTTFQFVIYLLMSVFQKTQRDAVELTISIDNTGYGIAGVYSKEIAEHKLAQSNKLIQEHGFPLKVTVEKE